MKELKKAFISAFPYTVPVMAGFVFLGMAFGIIMSAKGIALIWTFLTSFLIYAGSLQYVALTLYVAAFNPLYAFFIALMVNARHIFYGLSSLDKLKDCGKFKPYIIFALCDESFSILAATEPPPDVNRGAFYFFIVFLNRWYWILGSMLGAVIGNNLPFNPEGLDFALTAMFYVIFLTGFMDKKNRPSSMIGVLVSLICLLIFGTESFIVPAMLLMLIVFWFMTKNDKGKEAEQ